MKSMSVSEYSSSDSQASGGSPEFNSSDSPTHIPSHYVDPKTNCKPRLRDKLIKSRIFDRNIPFLFHSFNTITASSTISTAVNDCTNNSLLTERMEQRLIRWRPSINSTSIEDSLNGKHPYQTMKDDESNRKSTKQEETKRSRVADNSNNLKLLHSSSTLNLIQRLQDLKNENHEENYYKDSDTIIDNNVDIDHDNESHYENNPLLNNNSSSVYNVYNYDSNNFVDSDDVHIAPPLDLAKFYSSSSPSRPSSASSTLSMDCWFCCPLII